MDAAAYLGHIRAVKSRAVAERAAVATRESRQPRPDAGGEMRAVPKPGAKPPGDAGRPPFNRERYPASFAGRKPGSKNKAPRRRELKAALAAAIGAQDVRHSDESTAGDFLERFDVAPTTLSRILNQLDKGDLTMAGAVRKFAQAANRKDPGAVVIATATVSGPRSGPTAAGARRQRAEPTLGEGMYAIGGGGIAEAMGEPESAQGGEAPGYASAATAYTQMVLSGPVAAANFANVEQSAMNAAAANSRGISTAGGAGDRGVGQTPEAGGAGPGVEIPTTVGIALPAVANTVDDRRPLHGAAGAGADSAEMVGGGATALVSPEADFYEPLGVPPPLPPLSQGLPVSAENPMTGAAAGSAARGKAAAEKAKPRRKPVPSPRSRRNPLND